jgi:hypothetical protein
MVLLRGSSREVTVGLIGWMCRTADLPSAKRAGSWILFRHTGVAHDLAHRNTGLSMASSAPTTQAPRRPPSGSRNAQSARPGAGVTNVAWIVRRDIDYPEWVEHGRRLGRLARCSQWGLGDWINYGVPKYKKSYVQAAKITGYDVHTLTNMAYVASRFNSSRRRDNLTWSHHAELAPLEPDECEQWLDRASNDRLSVADLRIELRASRQGGERSQIKGSISADKSNSIVCPKCGHLIVSREPVRQQVSSFEA